MEALQIQLWRQASPTRKMHMLAQLNASAGSLTRADRLRFLRLYLGRPFRPLDRMLAFFVALKSRRIAAHTTKHGLWPAMDDARR